MRDKCVASSLVLWSTPSLGAIKTVAAMTAIVAINRGNKCKKKKDGNLKSKVLVRREIGKCTLQLTKVFIVG